MVAPRDYRASASPTAVEELRARETLKAVSRRLPRPSMMSATVVEWDGENETAKVHMDNSADLEVPDAVWAISVIGHLRVDERVWVTHMNSAAYVTGRSARANWQPVGAGDWAPTSSTGVVPNLGVGQVSQAGFTFIAGIVTMTFTISFGTGASNAGVGTWALPLPIAVMDSPGWDLQGRSMAFGTGLFFDGSDHIITFISTTAADTCGIRVQGLGDGLSATQWPGGNGAAPLAGTLIAGTLSYPGAG